MTSVEPYCDFYFDFKVGISARSSTDWFRVRRGNASCFGSVHLQRIHVSFKQRIQVIWSEILR